MPNTPRIVRCGLIQCSNPVNDEGRPVAEIQKAMVDKHIAMIEEAGKKGVEVPDPKAREIVYGMPYDEWKTKYQKEASADQKKAFDKAGHKH